MVNGGRDDEVGPGATGDSAGGSGPPPPSAPPMPGPPTVAASDRVRAACDGRAETDYIFHYWTALGWTFLTIGIYGFYVFYQLVRRMRDHNKRRFELFDASLTFAWEEAGRRGMQEELTPFFERASGHMDVLRRMTGDFRDPVIWLVLSIVARGVVEIIAFILLDQDLYNHDRAEVGVEHELAVIYGRLGQAVPPPDPDRVRPKNRYAGRIVATIVTLGIYMFWWYYDQMTDPNRHFEINWPQEDALGAAVAALAHT
jgi:hypothetical protein